MPVGDPLPHVAVHVVQTELVGDVRPHLARSVHARAAVVGELRRDLVAEVILLVGPRRPGAAGVLPLRLRRQTVRPARALLLLTLAELLEEVLRLVPRHVLDGEVFQVPVGDVGHARLAGAVAAVVAGVVAHDLLPLLLRHLADAEVEVPGDLDLVLRLLVGRGVRVVLGRAHEELAGRDALELHADAVGDDHAPPARVRSTSDSSRTSAAACGEANAPSRATSSAQADARQDRVDGDMAASSET